MCTYRIKSAPIRNRDTIAQDRPGPGAACPQLYDRPKKETARPAERNIESRPENTSERKSLTGSRVIYDSEGYWTVTQDNLCNSRKFKAQSRSEAGCDKAKKKLFQERRNVRKFIYASQYSLLECYHYRNVTRYCARYPGGVESRRLSIGSNFRQGAEGRPEKFTHRDDKGRQNDVLPFFMNVTGGNYDDD